MISGMVELITPRRAAGWAYTKDNSTPLLLRVRHWDKVLATARMECGPVDDAGKPVEPLSDGRFRDGRFRNHAFELEFSQPLEHRLLNAVRVEAAQAGTDEWLVLPKYLRVWMPFPDFELQQNTNLVRASDQTEAIPRTSFWSNDLPYDPVQSQRSRPVFVLGAARSGTTAVCAALQRATRYRGFPEGHVLDIAIRIIQAVNSHFEKKEEWLQPSALAAYHLGFLPHDRFRTETIDLIRRFASGYSTPFWFDKTPTYQAVASVPILAEAWPDARFLFMKRRGLENVRSRTRKFTGSDFTSNCKDWNIIMAGWRAVRDYVPGTSLELDQHDMAEDPRASAESIGALLALEPVEVEALASALGSERPESTGPAESIVAGISELGWSPDQVEIFRQICGAEMDAYGYTCDERYRA